ncbi:hypothetical protein AB0L40_25925, partial [Patulibacter sp. NPDC049589]
MHDALLRLAAVLADPGASGARASLDAVRAGWKALAADERKALTPLAKLVADRVAAAEAEARPSLFDLAPADAAPKAPEPARAGPVSARKASCTVSRMIPLRWDDRPVGLR